MRTEDILGQIAEATSHVREKADETAKAAKRGEDRAAEQSEMLDRLSAQVMALQEGMKKNQPYPANAPILSEEDERMIERGLFNGRMSAPYQRMLGTSPRHPLVKGSREAEDLSRLQDLHDCTAFRYSALNARMDSTMAIEVLSRNPDTIMWARELKRHGYIKDVETFLNPKSGMLADIAMTRANEVLSPQNTTQGLNNLTFTLVSGQLIDQVYVDLVIAANLTRIQLTRASQKFPKLTGLTQGIWGGLPMGSETPSQGGASQLPSAVGLMPADGNFQKPTIASLQFDAEHILSFLLFNDDMLEDSIIPWLPFIRSELSKNIARAIDDACYNGDSVTGTPGMDGHFGTNHARNAWNGLRYYCGAQANGWIHATTPTYTSGNMYNAGSTVMSLTHIEAAIMQLGKYGLRTDLCVMAVRPRDYLRIMMLPEFKLWTNAGNSMNLHNGVVGQIFGIDVVPTDIIPVLNEYGALNAGIGLSGTEDNSTAMIWRRDMFLLGMFDTVQVESTRWAPRLITIAQADVRADMQPVVVGSGFAGSTDATSGWPAVNILNMTL